MQNVRSSTGRRGRLTRGFPFSVASLFSELPLSPFTMDGQEASSLAANLLAQFRDLPASSALSYYAGLLVASSLLPSPPRPTTGNAHKAHQHPTSATVSSEPTSPSGSSPRTQPTSPAITLDATAFQLHLAAVRESFETAHSMVLPDLHSLPIDEHLKALLHMERTSRAAYLQLLRSVRARDAGEEVEPSEEDEEESLNLDAEAYDEASEEDAYSIDCSSPVDRKAHV